MRTLLAASIALTAMACAHGEPPTAQVAGAVAAMRGAEEAGALAVPQAALHLRLAEEQTQRARELSKKRDYERAHSLALRAREDAELAVALARENHARLKVESFTTTLSAGGEWMPDPAVVLRPGAATSLLTTR